ncbi:hypothetical protein D3C71_1320230 [compost metagenome]
MQADILAGIGLDLLVELDRVFLQLGDVGVTVDRVHAASRMPGGTGSKLGPLDQNHVRPAEFRQMVEDGTADDTAADHHNPGMALHSNSPVRAGLSSCVECCNSPQPNDNQNGSVDRSAKPNVA